MSTIALPPIGATVAVQPGGPDRRVPHERRPGDFEPGVATEITVTRYIQRRLADGDLVIAAPNPAPAGGQ